MYKRLVHVHGVDLSGWIVLAALVGAWQVITLWYRSTFFPPPSLVLNALVDQLLTPAILTDHLLPSLGRVLGGFLGATATGILFGVLIGYWRPVRDALDPIVQFLRSIPAPVVIPMAIMILGIGNAAKTAVIIFGACPPVLLNAIDGTRHVSSLLKDTARVFQRTPLEIVREVVLLAALPQVFAGLRVSLPIALVLMVVSEMVASTNGLGYFILRAQRTFRVPEMYAGIVLLGTLGYFLNAGFMTIERWVLRWHFGYQQKR